jgi:hypothetical protein
VSNDTEAHCFVLRGACGHVRGVVLDAPEHAARIAEWLRHGAADDTVKRMTVAAFKAMPFAVCDCES